MSEVDPIESAFLAGAVTALRRRVQRQDAIAKDGTTIGERNAVILQGEAAVAQRLAQAFNELADELEQGAPVSAHRDVRGAPSAGPLGAALALIDADQAQHKDSQQTGAD
jgi:hypothetical protein